jgi:hypothetical protein
MSMSDLCSKNEQSHAEKTNNTAAITNVKEYPKKKEVKPEISEPSIVPIPTSAL